MSNPQHTYHPGCAQAVQGMVMIRNDGEEDRPAGAEGGGGTGTGSPEHQQGCEETPSDDPCKITIIAEGPDGFVYDDTILDIGLSIWFHLKRQETYNKLKSGLRSLSFDIEEISHDDIVIKYMGTQAVLSNDLFMCNCKKIRVIIKEITQNYCQIVDPECEKDFIVRKWTETDLYQSRKATAHRAHSGHLIIVTEKDDRNCVKREIRKLMKEYRDYAKQLHDNIGNPSAIKGKYNQPMQAVQHASSHVNWEPVQDLFKEEDGMVKVLLQKTIQFKGYQQSFLDTQQEAQNYVVSYFEKMGIECAFDFKSRVLVLTADKDVKLVENSVLDDLIVREIVPFPTSSSCSTKDLPKLMEDKFQRSEGKFVVMPNNFEQSVTIVATKDIFPDIQSVIHMITVDVVEDKIELDRKQFTHLLLLKQWKAFEPLLVDINTRVVLIRPVDNDNKCLIIVLGTKANCKEFRSEIDGYVRSQVCNFIVLSHDKLQLLQTRPAAVKFIEQAVKKEGYEMHFRGNGVLILDDISRPERAKSHFIGLIVSNIIQQQEPLFESLTLEELEDILEKDCEVYHDRLMIDVNRHEQCLTLTGTKDIFPAVMERLDEIQAKYKRVEEIVLVSPETMEYFQAQGLSELQKMNDDLRLKVTVNITEEHGKPGCRLTGPMIEVAKVKGWIHNACTVKGRKNNGTSQVVTLKELEHKLLKESAVAWDFVREAYEKEGFGFDMDSKFRNATLTVEQSEDMSKAKRLLSACTKTFSVDFGEEQIDLTPKKAQDLLYRHEPDFSERMFVLANDTDNKLSLIVTKDVATTVIRSLKQMMDDYAHDEICLYLEPEEIGVVRQQVEKMKQEMKQEKSQYIELYHSSERVEMKGASVSVRQSWETICESLTVSKQSRNSKASHRMRMCEQAVSPLVCAALEKKEQIRSFLETYFDGHGYDFELLNNRIRFFAGSVTALQNVRKIFPSQIMKRRFSLVNEPVVKMLGMEKIGEELSDEPSCEGKIITDVDDSCHLMFVCTEDIKQIVEDHLHQMKQMYEEEIIEFKEEEHLAEKFELQQLEDELSHKEPGLKDKFRLYGEDGKLHVVAACDCLKLVKKKVEQVLLWKRRERKVAKNLPCRELKLSEIQFEFIQKPEVINYIDKELDVCQFEINEKRKSLWVYAVKKEHLLEKCKNLEQVLLKEDIVDMSNDPLAENVTLCEIKGMLDIQEAIHHGKLLIKVDEQKKCLNMICTDDVHHAVFSKLDGIKKTCSDRTFFLPLSSEKWSHIRKLYPKVFQEMPKAVRMEYCSPESIQIVGPKEQAIQVKTTLEDIIETLHVEEFPLSDDIDILQTDEGQKLINDIQEDTGCMITIKEHETCEKEASGVVVKDYLSQLHLKLTNECITLSQWISKGNCTITVIQGRMDDLHPDILAVPVVGGELPLAFSCLKTDYPTLHMKIQNLNYAKNDMLWIQTEGCAMTWLKIKRVVFFCVPITLKEGKDKEKESVRKTVKSIIAQEARRSQTPRIRSCVFVIETLNKKGLYAAGIKAIIRGSQEAFEEGAHSIDVQLLADKTISSEVVKTMDKACPESRKISLLKQVKKLKKMIIPGKEKTVELSKPSIEVVVGRLEKVKVDVLVNSAHHKLDLRCGVVSRALNAASKGQLQRECNEKYSDGLEPGEVAITKFQSQTGKSCRVFHGCLLKYPLGAHDKSIEDDCWKVMSKFIYLCLHEANNLGAESIAFPVLGTGTLNYPVQQVANVMFEVVEWFFNANLSLSLKTVKFVVYEGNKDIIQVFHAESMARNYQCRTSQGPLETRQKCGNIMLQFIASDLRLFNGITRGLLCFWQKHQLQDPERHPLVGQHLKSIKWTEYGPDLASRGETKTTGDGLHADIIFHTLVETDFITALDKGLKNAVVNYMRTVQVMLFPRDVAMSPQAFVSDLQDILKQRNITCGILSLVTVVVPDQTWYTEAVAQLNNSSGFISYIKTATSNLLHKIQPSSTEVSAETDGCAQLVVSGRSEEDCKQVYSKVMEGTKQLKEGAPISENGSPVDDSNSASESATMAAKDSAADVDVKKTIITWKGNVYHLFLQNGALWREKAEELESLGQIHIEDHADHTYMVGQFEEIAKVCKYMGETYNIEPDQKLATGACPKTSEGYVDMKVALLDAVAHLFGQDQVSMFCQVKDDPGKLGQKKIFFRHSSEAQAFKQRIMGIIQEELSVPESDWHRGESAAKQAMKGYDDVYITYDMQKHTMIMFAENWDSMAKAKRRVQHKTGQGKTSSRGNRKFAANKTLAADNESTMEQGTSPSKCNTFQGTLLAIKVYETDITTLPVDVVVNAANERLSHGGGVARAIAKAAGSAMDNEGDKIVANRLIPVTELAVTTAGKLPSKQIFHAVGPRWSAYENKDLCSRDLCFTILRCLCAARNLSFSSIAFPSISAAIFAVPKDVCARMYVQALKTFDKVVSGGSLREVHFVDISDTMVTAIVKELMESWKTPLEEKDLETNKTFINRCLGTYFGISFPHSNLSNKSNDKYQQEAESFPAGQHEVKEGYFKFSDMISVNIYQHDIFDIKASALVSWEDTSLFVGRPLIKAMIHAGGPGYEAERKRIKSQVSVQGNIALTSGGKLNQDNIFHAVVGLSINPANFATLLRSVLGLCVKNKCSNVLIPVCNQIYSGVSSQNALKLFIESMVDSLSDLSRHKSSPTLHVHILDKQQHVVDDLTRLLQQYLMSCGHVKQSTDNQKTEASGGEQCVICLSAIVHPKKLKCGHTFCTECIDNAFKHKKVCPTCKTVCGVITGTMPQGSMNIYESFLSVPGYEECGSIEITYRFSGGYQKEEHPNPGTLYAGFTRKAYLPNNAEGQKVLSLLEVAWKRRLTFTIGRSVTMSKDSCITWNEIHHKTNRSGGPTNHGYPDPDYLRRVQEELADQGVTEEDLGATGSSAGTAV